MKREGEKGRKCLTISSDMSLGGNGGIESTNNRRTLVFRFFRQFYFHVINIVHTYIYDKNFKKITSIKCTDKLAKIIDIIV